MLKILQIIPTLEKGGAEHLVIDICNELLKREGVEVKLITFRDINSYKFLTKNLDIQVCSARVIPSIRNKNIIEINNFINIIKNFKPDIIHSHLYESEVVSREIVFPDIIYFSHFHDNIRQFQKFSFKTILSKRRFTDYYEKLRLIPKYKKCKNNFIAISGVTYNYALNSLPKELQNITLLNNAVDFKRFNSSNFYKVLNFRKTVKLITIGSLLNNKNHVFLVNVIKYLKKLGYNSTLDILGGGPNFNIIDSIIHSDKLEENVFLRGEVDNIEEYIQNADIYVHSAKKEAFGLVMVEAMAAGLPCVALDAIGNRDIIKNGINGYILPKPDVEMFAAKIIDLINDEKKYNTISENAIETAKGFDISIYVDKLLEIYSNKLREKL